MGRFRPLSRGLSIPSWDESVNEAGTKFPSPESGIINSFCSQPLTTGAVSRFPSPESGIINSFRILRFLIQGYLSFRPLSRGLSIPSILIPDALMSYSVSVP